MASDQELSVKITGDTTGLTKATDAASKSLDGLRKDVQGVDSETIDIQVETNAEDASKGLDDLKKKTDSLDSESVEIPAALELTNLNRDMGNLRKVLDGIERRKAEPEVGLDITQLLRDEAKVKKELNALDQRKVEVEASMSVDASGLDRLKGAIGSVMGEVSGEGGSGGGLIGGLGLARVGLTAVGTAGLAAVPVVGQVAVGLGLAAKGAWELGEAAADVETSVTQLGALVGNQELGAETFQELQKWAASTPFAIDDATEATKRLVAAGVPLKKIPDYLNDLGNVASASGKPLDELAAIFGQMESSGKASYENLQQLADAGIPVWGELSKQIGLTVADTQKLAIEGKLGADAIDLVRESLNAQWPNAMSDQAATFNGQMSTLKDNFDQTKQTLGTFFLPAMSELMGLFNTGAGWILDAARSLAEWNTQVSDATGGLGIVGLLSPAVGAVHFLTKAFGDDKKAAKAVGDETEKAAAKVKASLEAAAQSPEMLKKAFDSAVQALGDIGVNVRAHVSFIISQAQLQREIDKATSGKDAVELPANLNIKQLRGLSDKQFAIIQSLSSYAEQGLQRGMELAASNPNFDFSAFYKKLRAQLKPLLIEANIDPSQIDRVLTNILGIPRPVAVKPVVKDYEDARDKMNAPLTVPITPKAVDVGAAKNDIGQVAAPRVAPIKATPTNIHPANQSLDMTAAERKAWMKALTTNVGQTDRILDGLAATRTVHYALVLDESLYAHMDDRLDRLAGTRTATFNTVGGGGPTAAPGIAPRASGVMWSQPLAGGPLAVAAASMSGSTATMFLPSQQKAPVVVVQPAKEPVQLRPRQTPIKVYLDGEEIATHMELRAARLATSTTITGRRA